MGKGNLVNSAMKLSYNKINSDETGFGVDNVRIIDDNKPKGAKNKIDIVAKEKQKDGNNKIYYALKWEQNPNNASQNQQNKYIN